WIERILLDDPFTTLQVVLEPLISDFSNVSECICRLTQESLEVLLAACHRNPTYLDRFYALQPGRPIGAKRLVVLLPAQLRKELSPTDWLRMIEEYADIVWQEDEAPKHKRPERPMLEVSV